MGGRTQEEALKTFPILEFFRYEHLPERLASIAKPICDYAFLIGECYPEKEETKVGLRKLLEAKDCLVRTML